MSGDSHVFVVNGTLQEIHCDAVVVPTDDRFSVREYWWPLWGGGKPPRPEGWDRDPIARMPGQSKPRVWFIDSIVSQAGKVGERAAEAIKKIAAELWRSRPPPKTSDAKEPEPRPPLIAVPVIGPGGGGHNLQRGELIGSLLGQVRSAAGECGVDVVIVAKSHSSYAALQAARWPKDFAAYPQLSEAKELGARAEHGELALSPARASLWGPASPPGINCWKNSSTR
jgi:hypothetical protein